MKYDEDIEILRSDDKLMTRAYGFGEVQEIVREIDKQWTIKLENEFKRCERGRKGCLECLEDIKKYKKELK